MPAAMVPVWEGLAVDKREKIIFFGNGRLAEYALEVLGPRCEVIFRVRTREDLAGAVEAKRISPEAHGVLASFGVMVPEAVLREFEPEGILNIHPSLLPKYRGPSPIESAILAGDEDFGVSVMKLVKKMDAGPIYVQATIKGVEIEKETIYRNLARAGAEMALKVLQTDRRVDPAKLDDNQRAWLEKVLRPEAQDESRATYTRKFEKADGRLAPLDTPRAEVLRQIIAFQGFPKAKCIVLGHSVAILGAHIPKQGEIASLALECQDGPLAIDSLQPDGRGAMDAKSFLNGYGR